MSEELFIYGTLRLPEVQRKIIGREVELVADTLAAYKAEPVVIDGTEYRTLVPDQGSAIDGAVISVTPDELARIDAYEPEEYHRKLEITASGRSVWVYVKA